eukprot:5217853-Amphidinium_carterae.1
MGLGVGNHPGASACCQLRTLLSHLRVPSRCLVLEAPLDPDTARKRSFRRVLTEQRYTSSFDKSI